MLAWLALRWKLSENFATILRRGPIKENVTGNGRSRASHSDRRRETQESSTGASMQIDSWKARKYIGITSVLVPVLDV